MARHAALALACAMLLAFSAAASAADAANNNKTQPITTAVSAQPDLSSFAAILKFVGVADELAKATEANVIVYAPNNAAVDAFAKTMTSNAKATGKDLLQVQYLPVLTHLIASHITEDDNDDDVYKSFGGQALLVEDDKGDKKPKVEGTVQVLPSKSITANILREEDLGGAGDLYIVDRVLKPDNVFATPSDAFKAKPELAAFGRLAKALALPVVQRSHAGAPATTFVPTSSALDKYLAKAGLTEAKILAGTPDLQSTVTATLCYHVVPGIGLVNSSLASGGWKLKTALIVAPEKSGSAGGRRLLADAAAFDTLKVPKAPTGKLVVVEGDLSKGQVTSQVYAGAQIIHTVDEVLAPNLDPAAVAAHVASAGKEGVAADVDASAIAAVVAPAAAAAGPSGRRKLMRTASRNSIISNTQRTNIQRAVSGTTTVTEAAILNNRVTSMAPISRIPDYFLYTGPSVRRGGFLVGPRTADAAMRRTGAAVQSIKDAQAAQKA